VKGAFMKPIVIVLSLLFFLPQFSYTQNQQLKNKNKKKIQKEEQPSTRQLDLIERMHSDMTNINEDNYYIFNEAYHVGYRVKTGLTSDNNLVDLILYIKKQGQRISLEGHAASLMYRVFPSLTREERDHFLSLSDGELDKVAKKYAKWISKILKEREKQSEKASEEWEAQPKY
jgi:uncharacterized protein (UPF0335 family)